MKVVSVDNFDRDAVSDFLVRDRLTPEEAEAEAARLNERSGPDAQLFYRAVPDDYVLKVWEP